MTRITSINVNGLNSHKCELEKHILQHKFDIVCIQETHKIIYKEVEGWANRIGYSIFTNWVWDHTKKNQRTGTAILINKKIIKLTKKHEIKEKNRRQEITIRIKGMDLKIINVYAPSGAEQRKQREIFYDEIKESLETEVLPCIIMGDFNMIIDKRDAKITDKYTQLEYEKRFERCMAANDMEDIYRIQNPKKKVFTHKSRNQERRLDRIYTPKEIREEILECDYVDNNIADHPKNPFIQLKSWESFKRNTWKCNKNILEDEEYRSIITNLLETEKCNIIYHIGIQDWWENVKKKIKNVSKRYEQFKRKSHLGDKKQQWMNENLRIQAKQINIEEGEQSPRVFWKEMKKKKNQTILLQLEKEDGKMAETESELLTEVHDYYDSMLGKISDDDKVLKKKYINMMDIKMSKEKNAVFDMHVTEDEIENILKKMKKEKSPGMDGLTKEFYITFWSTIKTELTIIVNNALLFGNIPNSWNDAKIVLIHKKGDRQRLTNWRPVSLLNIDYKIAAKILSCRLGLCLNDVISKTQKAGLPERYIQDIHYNLESYIRYTKNRIHDAFIMTIDYAKAFDTVNHSYLLGVLDKIGLNQRAQRMFKKIYKEMKCKVEVNGSLTKNIKIRRGIRQGCPMSMTLYALSTEPMMRKILQNENIIGCKLGGKVYKADQFADDTTLTIEGMESIRETISELKDFEKATGQKINEEKTEILAININGEKNLCQSKFGIYKKDNIKILGIYYGKDAEEKNLEDIRQNINLQGKIIKQRKLSWSGKLMAINAFIIGHLNYKSITTKITKKQAGKYETDLFNILWSPERIEAISRNVMKLEKKFGGINMIDIESKINAARLTKFIKLKKLTEPEEFWHMETIYNLGTRIREINPKLYYNNMPHRTILKNEWKECLDLWKLLNNKKQKVETAKEIYLILKTSKLIKHKRKEREWRKIWMEERKYKGTILNKLKETSYRVTMEGYMTGSRKIRAGWTMKRNQKIKLNCKFCKAKLDTAKHLFTECKKIEWITTDILNEQKISTNEMKDIKLEDLYENSYQESISLPTIKLIAIIKYEIMELKTKCDAKNRYTNEEDVKNLKEKVDNHNKAYI